MIRIDLSLLHIDALRQKTVNILLQGDDKRRLAAAQGQRNAGGTGAFDALTGMGKE